MDPTNANTALASAFAEELARGGLRLAVISPGSRSTPLAVALWRQPEIEISVIVDERSAGFFAVGAAQASGQPVALLCTSGTALVNYHPAVVEADESGIPLLVLSADRPPELRGIGAGQTIDQVKTFGSSIRWFSEVGTHDADDGGLLHYRSVACRALTRARGEVRPGPVHLNLPWREPLAPVPVEGTVIATDPLALEGRGKRPLTAVTQIDQAPSAFLLDEVAGHLRSARSGVIVAGRQLDPELREPLAHLARVSGFPILADPTSQLRCGPHDRSHVVAAYDLLLRDENFAASVAPDLVLRFGEMPTSKPLREWIAGSEADQLIVDPDGGWNEPSNRAAAILRADPVGLASGWAERLKDQEPTMPTRWLEAEAAAQAALTEAFEADASLTEPALHRALGAAHRDGDLVYTSSSMPIRDQEAFLPASSSDLSFLSNRGANGIDGLLSSGIGAARASGRPTTIVSGDLGLLHDLGGLAALRDVSTPVRIVVIDNAGGGIFHFLPQEAALPEDEFEALLGTPRGIDAAKAAALFDLPHRRLESLTHLPDALAAGTCLIEVKTDRQTNVEIHRKLAQQVHAALAEVLRR
jgi:2-succinyl-5-enolpyruvyl-6-hydroxy-3-cyclohexene-1-carboxylate synthase